MSDNAIAYRKPPESIKAIYKTYQKLDQASLNKDTDIIALNRMNGTYSRHLKQADIRLLPTELLRILVDFKGSNEFDDPEMISSASVRVCEVKSVPGLFIYPSLLPPEIQICLLDKLLHRDLCNPQHKTNVHLHHDVQYPPVLSNGNAASYFGNSALELVFRAKDSTVHQSLATSHFLNRKLRWLTLGGQYDWTNKVYPSGPPPDFPLDIKHLIEGIFPMKAEAAIVNLYSPGDTLSLHRDVSEECNQPLVSISIGCDGIFVVGLSSEEDRNEVRSVTIRLRSGDAVLMSGESRFAWHGVPKVLEDTCPEWLEDWPFQSAKGGKESEARFEQWKGWMKGKRINLNVRQMFA